MSTLVAHEQTAVSSREIYEIGEVPPIGQVPRQMYAQVIRADRFGDPIHAFKVEKIPVPELRPDEALVYVMAAGVNFNNVWAALGYAGQRHRGAAEGQVRLVGFPYRR